MSSESSISTALSLLRRLPPNKVEQNLSGLLNLLPDDTDELLQRVDQPLQEATDKDTVCWCQILGALCEIRIRNVLD